jgi:hypothetical protein
MERTINAWELTFSGMNLFHFIELSLTTIPDKRSMGTRLAEGDSNLAAEKLVLLSSISTNP